MSLLKRYNNGLYYLKSVARKILLYQSLAMLPNVTWVSTISQESVMYFLKSADS